MQSRKPAGTTQPTVNTACQLIVKFKSTASARREVSAVLEAAPDRSPGARATRTRTPRTALSQLIESGIVKQMQPVFPDATTRRVAATGRVAFSVPADREDTRAGFNLIEFDNPDDSKKACQLLMNDRSVAYAHHPQERFLYAAPKRRRAARPRTRTGPDPLQNRQWGLTAVRWFEALGMPGFQNASNIDIAVIDTGVDSSHPDLRKSIGSEMNFTTATTKDTVGHGTHVSGIIAASTNNRVGISGVCQSRRIHSLKALGPYSSLGYYRAIGHCIDNGVHVLNLSLGGGEDPTERDLITDAINAGVVVVAAMGNEFQEGNPTSYPAALEGVISVGASTETDAHAPFSNTGRFIDLVAPGTNILSTVPTYPSTFADGTDYEAWPGTSMASPFVAATVALMLAKNAALTLDQITRRLHLSCDKVPGQNSFNRTFGHGRLNIEKAVARA